MSEYYKVIKLRTGESILCSVQTDVRSLVGESFITLNMPVQVVETQQTRQANTIVGESFFLRPWMGLSDGEEFTISTDMVLTIGDLKPEVRAHYVKYVKRTQEANKFSRDTIERSEAADELLKEVSNGNLHYVDDDNTPYDDFEND